MQVLLATLKDHLGSWTTITDAGGFVEREQSFDAWGNLRDPETWTGYTAPEPVEGPMFDRGFTGHEHIAAFGLINMNGRCYDPITSNFLSVDAYIQSPDNSQSFNRYAYCQNNPLRYTDPTGWQMVGGTKRGSPTTGLGWGDMKYVDHAYTWRELCEPGVRGNVAMAVLASYRIGNDCSIDGFVSVTSNGNISDIDVMITPITPTNPYNCTNKLSHMELNSPVSSETNGKCVVTALGSTKRFWFTSTRKYGDGTRKWIEKVKAYEEETGKGFNVNLMNLVEFIQWNDNEGSYSSYQVSPINVSQIKEALENDFVVGVCVYLTNPEDISNNSGMKGHFANVLTYFPNENGSVKIGFIEPNGTNYMRTYEAPNTSFIWLPPEYSAMNFIKYKLNP